jgi:16S rRNA (adenine1518-N6/adenine1519-N6)-dimethyltransferase
MNRPKPLRRFGQNYLTDQNILNKIVNEINPKEDENLIEIGPGTGSLTKKLLERVNHLTAIEIDNRVTENLSEKFPSLKIIQGDFLDYDLRKIFAQKNQLLKASLAKGGKLKIVGNIPYNLTSSILFKLMENYNIISDAIFMVQLEVAKRMTAQKGTKDYGILSVLLSYFCDVKICFKVSPNVFYPKPNVYSAVVHIIFNKSIDENIVGTLKKIVKASFNNRRKTLKNSLSNSIFKNINFAESGINLALRPEQLDIQDYILLSEFAIKHPDLNENQKGM